MVFTLATDIVCCSMASSSALCSADGTSPNSSMQQIPPSARGIAPACKVHCWPTLMAAAVRPAWDVPRPVVATDLHGAATMIWRSQCSQLRALAREIQLSCLFQHTML